MLAKMTDRGIIALHLMSPLCKTTTPENVSQFNLVKDSSSNRVNDFLKSKTIPVILNGNLLTFSDTNKQFELKEDLLKMITNTKYKVDLANLSVKKIMYETAKERNFDERAPGKKLTEIDLLYDYSIHLVKKFLLRVLQPLTKQVFLKTNIFVI